jgi:hypothetical protein
VGEAGQVDTIAGEEFVTRPDPTVRYCWLLHQSFDGVISSSLFLCFTNLPISMRSNTNFPTTILMVVDLENRQILVRT